MSAIGKTKSIGRGIAAARTSRKRSPRRTSCTYPWCECAGAVGYCPAQPASKKGSRP